MLSGSENKEKINVAFPCLSSMEWAGGIYYFRNLIHAISSLEDRQIHPFICVGKKTSGDLVKPLEKYATVIRSTLFDKNSFLWNISRIMVHLTGSNFLMKRLLVNHHIQVVSHSNVVETNPSYKVLNWIPDLQHLHLPELFTKKEIFLRNYGYKKFIRSSDVVIVSSEDAKADIRRSSWCYGKEIKVLNFVSQVKLREYGSDLDNFRSIQKKYNFHGKFFYLPNQFWQHKNHQIVFSALNILKKAGVEILVLCSGYMNDFRKIDHVNQLKQYITENNLGKNIKLLGLIDRENVFTLMRFSLAVINPSLFEGWSSTVEEAKSMGKGMILSDINVHKEQNPPASSYFNPLDANKLADILVEYWQGKEGGPDFKLEEEAQKELPQRTREFGLAYQNIVKESLLK